MIYDEPPQDDAPQGGDPLHDSASLPYTDGADTPADADTPTDADAPMLMEDRAFEDLTLAEAAGQFVRAPISTLRALKAVAQTPTYTRPRGESAVLAAPAYLRPRADVADDGRISAAEVAVLYDADVFPASGLLTLVQWLMRLLAVAAAVVGGVVMFNTPTLSEETGLNRGVPYLLAGFLIWLLSELTPSLFASSHVEQVRAVPVREASFAFTPARLFAAGAGLATSVLAFVLNNGNMFTTLGVIEWGLSIVFWVWAVAPQGWNPWVGVQRGWRWLTTTRITLNPTLIMLLLIMFAGAFFRFQSINATPPEMTSDHVEKLFDVNRVLHGETNIFFANNDGRDAIQFYALALLSQLPGMNLDFYLLKLMTVLEGLVTIPLLFWMGREVIGKEQPRLANAVGLIMAGLVAVSYWHEMLSRLGLRIVLTPLFTALVIIFLVRAVRYNRRRDFILTGLALGFSLYAYQAMRMMPVAVLLVVGVAFVFGMPSLAARRQMLLNLVALVIVSFAVFVPLFGFSVQYPEDFWRRTSGRLFGDDITRTTDEAGNIVMRTPTIQERVDAFNQNIPVLMNNVRNALLMYNWKGDVAWINNAPNHPALDPLTGGFLIVGVAAWLARMFRRRDAFDWSLVPLILIMMLPSVLTIAYPIENPSASRISGTLPGIYLLIAVPLALIVLALPRLMGKALAWCLPVFGVVAVLWVSYDNNAPTYFEDYSEAYSNASLPYSVGGRALSDFASANGYGNAFIIAYPYWWDHRALAIEGGNIDWGNTILTLDNAPVFLRDASWRTDDTRLDPTKDLLFFYSPDDLSAQEWLEENFPQGSSETVITYQPAHPFNLYRVPAIGQDAFTAFLRQHELVGEVG